MAEMEMEILQGTVGAVVYQNYDNGYSVLRLGCDNGQTVTVVGTIPLPTVGERLMVTGKWSNLSEPEYKKVFEYYKGLIRFRKAHGALRMKTAEEVYSHISDVETGEKNVPAFHLWGNVNGEVSEAIFVVFNGENAEKEIALPVGKWSVRVFDETAGDEHLFFAEEKIKIPPLSAAVMVK